MVDKNDLEVSINGGTRKWMIYESPNLEWMMNTGTPIDGNPHFQAK